ncbi:MAG: Uma2 family endonuclease [Cyanosarcina radialis HA8281-LM2]|jgi:Uma2 family endonuclease|nr:Uma2 family endonuclease [Cyanosarcina radialis HA8281-LM2]
MTQTLTKTTFAEFVESKPEDKRYELHRGVIVEMARPLGGHEEVIGFLVNKLVVQYEQLELPYLIPKQALVKLPDEETSYLPDVLVLNRPCLESEPLWKKFSTVQNASSIPLVVEVVSTNWRDDYLAKLKNYEEIGIPEYWIVDYLGLGKTRYIGNPKSPTISIYYLLGGEYQVSYFREGDRLSSPTFPELNLTAEQIFQAGATVK